MELIHELRRNRKGNALFIAACLLFIAHQVLEPYKTFPLIDSYLDDVLCLPIVLWLAQILLSVILRRPFILPLLYVVCGTAAIALAAELVFPMYNTYFIYDPYDFIAYGAGASIFHLCNENK